MSQAHIPQPNANAPGEQIASTDSVPPQVSIEIPSPSFSQEVTPALGEMNQLDPWFYTQFRRIATVQWSVADESGKLLWWIPLSPLYMDKNLAYVMQMYVGWAGDFIFNFKIAGTGFHAGLVTMCKFPPTVHPTKVGDPKDYTVFPWDATDPKMLEIGSAQGRDIRPIKYHYTQEQEHAPPDYYLGGYMALFVDLPLTTSASGVQRVNIAIWAKLAPNFRVSWIVPYDLQTLREVNIPPPALEDTINILNTKTPVPLANANVPVDTVYVYPGSVKVLNTGLFNNLDLAGKSLSKLDSTSFAFNDQQTMQFIRLNDTKLIFEMNFPCWQYWPQQMSAFVEGSSSSVGSFFFDSEWTDDKANFPRALYKIDIEPKTAFANDTRVWIAYSYDTKVHPCTFVDNQIAPLTSSEAFMVWSGTRDGVPLYSPQHLALSTLFRTGRISEWMPPNSAALFTILETSSNLPLGYAKLYQQGFFTVRARPDAAKFDASQIRLKFYEFIPETAEIPGTTDTARNYLLVQYHHAMNSRSTSSRSSSNSRSTRRHHGSSSSSSDSRKQHSGGHHSRGLPRSSDDPEKHSVGNSAD